jgi:sec-independent protein translocase protein TatA
MGIPQGWELVLIVVVIVLLFGARKLPDAARGLGRSLRIFKSEIKDPNDEEGRDAETDPVPPAAAQQTITAAPVAPITPVEPVPPTQAVPVQQVPVQQVPVQPVQVQPVPVQPPGQQPPTDR